MNKPNKIIIHHSATADNKTLSSFDAIRNYHIKTNGWNDIGYHYLFEYVNGKITCRQGRKENVTGAHTVGQNSTSIGICVVGNFDKDTPTNDMYKAVANKCLELFKKYGKMPIEPHNKYANKSCPGKNFDMKKLISYTVATTPSTTSSKPPESVKYGIVTATTLNVRKGRSTTSKVIGKLKKGEQVKIDKLIGDWYSIYYGKNGGFVHKDYLKLK